jgi:hypothetical protein
MSALCMKRNGKTLCVGGLPGRTRVALYWYDALTIHPVAYFTRESEAEAVKDFFEAGAREGARLVIDPSDTPREDV